MVAIWGSAAIGANICEKVRKKLPLGAHLGAKIAQVGAKMALSCPTWRQDVPKMANLEPKMANLAHFWEHLGNFCLHLGRDLAKNVENQTKYECTALLKFFGGPGAPLGGYVGLSWAILVLSWAILALSWAILVLSWSILAPSCDNLATRCGPRAPRRFQKCKIYEKRVNINLSE